MGGLCSCLWGGKGVSLRAGPSLECSGCRAVQPGLTPRPPHTEGPPRVGLGALPVQTPSGCGVQGCGRLAPIWARVAQPALPFLFPFPDGAARAAGSGGSAGSPHGGPPLPRELFPRL